MLHPPTQINIFDLIAGADEARFSNYEVSDSLKIFQIYEIRVTEKNSNT
jgi:hypothetical protein